MRTRSRPIRGEPTWEVAQLYPAQGDRGVYGTGRRATGLLKGFAVDVSKLFKTADAARKSGGADE
jgi:hypothetical protein